MRKSNLISNLITAAIFIILEVAALNMLNSSPIQRSWFAKGGHIVMGSLWGTTQDIKHYFSLKEKNEKLAMENFILREQMLEMNAIIRDSVRVSRIQADGVADGYRYIPAAIVKISNNTQHNYLIIGKGAKDGVKEGSGIITGKGAIGVIDAVSDNYAYARSFKNHGMNISARLGRNGTVGPVSWDGYSNDGALLREIPHHVEFSPGDTVYTSGYSSIFPPDIPIGTAGESEIVNGSTYEIKVRMFEDFGALRYVTVVENLGKDEIQRLEKNRR